MLLTKFFKNVAMHHLKKKKTKRKVCIPPLKTNPELLQLQNTMERCLDMLFYDIYLAPFAPYQPPSEYFEMQLVRLHNAAAQCRTIRPFSLHLQRGYLVRRKAEKDLTALLW